jgi:TolB-like protein
MPDLFLSYSREDQPTARRFADALKREGFDVWWDQTLRSGEAYDEVTEHALRDAKAVVVLWSRRSVSSRWVRAEATIADRAKKLVPAMIELCDRPVMFELTQSADLTHWQGDTEDPAWRTYVADLRQHVGQEAAAPTASSPTPTPTPAHKGRMPSALQAVLIAALAAGSILLFQQIGTRGKPPAPMPAAAAAPAARVTLAVLPFADMSPGHDQEYLSDGLSEEILNELAQIAGLEVRGRTSSFAFKGKNEDMRLIGEKLDAGYLLEGSVRKSGDQLRITAQLIRAQDASHLWSKTYDGELKNIFTVQEDVARDVATALSVKLDVGDLSRASGGTTNIEAYEKFLQARAANARNDGSGNEQSMELLRGAVQLDADFGAAWVALSQGLYDSERPELEKELADNLARNVRMAPEAPWTQHLLAYDHLAHYRWVEADAAVAKVLGTAYGSRRLVDPWANPPIYLQWARLFTTGRAAEAFQLTDAWVRTDPLSLYASTVKIMFLPSLGRFEELPAEIRRSRSLSGDHWVAEWSALMGLMSGGASPDAIKEQFALFVRDEPKGSLNRRLFERLGNPAAARAELHKAMDDPHYAWQTRVLAEFADAFDDKELAITILRKEALEPRWRTPFNLGYLLWYPYKTGLRSDPRFKDLLRQIGLVDYWRKTGVWGDYCRPTTGDDFECH